jgi:hypothetical protein
MPLTECWCFSPGATTYHRIWKGTLETNNKTKQSIAKYVSIFNIIIVPPILHISWWYTFDDVSAVVGILKSPRKKNHLSCDTKSNFTVSSSATI